MTTLTHEERPVWIALNGVRRIVLSCSPHDPEALVVGHLLSEGWIESADQLANLRTTSGPGAAVGVTADVDDALIESAERLHSHQTLHGCGLRHFLDCSRDDLRPVKNATAPVDAVPLLRELFAAVDRDAQDGGLHAVAVSDGVTLVDVAYDVARHCAVDRAIGVAAQRGVELTRHGLVSTARISGAMALKAVRSGLAWIAGRSIATSLAREIADAYGLVLRERAGKMRNR